MKRTRRESTGKRTANPKREKLVPEPAAGTGRKPERAGEATEEGAETAAAESPRERELRRKRETYHARKAQGLCTRCTKEAGINARGERASMCDEHMARGSDKRKRTRKRGLTRTELDEKARQHREWYAKRRLAGGCVLCRRPAAITADGTVRAMCEEHLEYNRVATRKQNARLRERPETGTKETQEAKTA